MLNEVIPDALGGERIDRVVALATGASRSAVSAWIVEGRVQLNGAPVTGRSARVEPGDELVIDAPAAVAAAELEPEPDIDLTLVHVDDDIIVIDKPPGLVVHPGAGHATGTLVHGLLARFPEIAGVGPDPSRPGIVHRLDRDTSGLLVVARTPAAYETLVDELRHRAVGRRYQALVWGVPEPASGVIDGAIGRSRRSRTRMAVTETGKEARTRYALVETFRSPVTVALVGCTLETGRTHQIRVHLDAIGHPVVGDRTYGGHRQSFEVPRVFLHAAELELEHPHTGEALVLRSPLPPDLVAVLDRLS
ncbi:MAG: RluA family pseudouridine synthase [Acidimicrobiales bacterium]